MVRRPRLAAIETVPNYIIPLTSGTASVWRFGCLRTSTICRRDVRHVTARGSLYTYSRISSMKTRRFGPIAALFAAPVGSQIAARRSLSALIDAPFVCYKRLGGANDNRQIFCGPCSWDLLRLFACSSSHSGMASLLTREWLGWLNQKQNGCSTVRSAPTQDGPCAGQNSHLALGCIVSP
jgi:hypothetical protein